MDLALRISEYSFTLPLIASNYNLVQLVCLKPNFYKLYKNLLFLTNRKTQQSKQKFVTQIRSSAHAISFFDRTLVAQQTYNRQESTPHYQ
jgi:hypothetical protein